MVMHRFICPKCENVLEDSSSKGIHVCACGEDMYWDLSDGSDTMGGGRQYAQTHWSESLAISPSQIKAHKKLFPDVDVRSDGAVGFRSVKDQDKYLKACGFEKREQKLKPTANR